MASADTPRSVWVKRKGGTLRTYRVHATHEATFASVASARASLLGHRQPASTGRSVSPYGGVQDGTVNA